MSYSYDLAQSLKACESYYNRLTSCELLTSLGLYNVFKII